MKKPSMSELLQLLDKPALLKWANKQGLAGINIGVRKRKDTSEGTSIHSKIERFIKHGEQFEEQENFIKFISDKEILGIEQDIETEYFKGRYDLKIKWNEKIYMVDYKKSAKRVYLENKLQLVGYGLAENCNDYMIVSIPDFTVFPVEIANKEPYIEILKSLSNIYTQKQIIESYGTI